MTHSETFSKFEGALVQWRDQFIEQGSPISADGMAEKTKEFYYIAYHLYRDQQYEEAENFFRMLLMAKPTDPRYWKGLGACLQMRQNYEEALNCYICTQNLHWDQPDPYLYIYAADCYFALNQIKEGLKALEAARLSAEEKEDARILKHVAVMREMWAQSS
ncbi:MAG: tetratricopeptide repeat protein [Candidatus Protochlamydia sp.]|nr:tetratricopeptide repeat protein [Candidatus Protochlamydia sp.]